MTKDLIHRDKHIGITLKLLLNKMGEIRFKAWLSGIKYLGPKRIEALLNWLKKIEDPEGDIDLDLNEFTQASSFGGDLSRWVS